MKNRMLEFGIALLTVSMSFVLCQTTAYAESIDQLLTSYLHITDSTLLKLNDEERLWLCSKMYDSQSSTEDDQILSQIQLKIDQDEYSVILKTLHPSVYHMFYQRISTDSYLYNSVDKVVKQNIDSGVLTKEDRALLEGNDIVLYSILRVIDKMLRNSESNRMNLSEEDKLLLLTIFECYDSNPSYEYLMENLP